ncbi:hypothetical protein B0J11DRAFT_315314 [Dendryphion nanum]|uniref:Uncharacterized protein n=1 Tax=Dendryphion nanum TaxID=256645 RepID=A0A9P9DR54_9PLEO|nr:hypothetical protein B0J11DRAFT_315314 [Dendryphion nanum]
MGLSVRFGLVTPTSLLLRHLRSTMGTRMADRDPTLKSLKQAEEPLIDLAISTTQHLSQACTARRQRCEKLSLLAWRTS